MIMDFVWPLVRGQDYFFVLRFSSDLFKLTLNHVSKVQVRTPKNERGAAILSIFSLFVENTLLVYGIDFW